MNALVRFLRRAFLLPSGPLPYRPMTRAYEWRYLKTGAPYLVPALHENACKAWLAEHARGNAITTGAAVVERPIGVFVVATGERVDIRGVPGERARLVHEDAEWVCP